MAWDDKGQLSENGHEQENDERVGEGDEKSSHSIVQIRPLGHATVVHVLHRVRPETDDTEDEQHDASCDLQEETVLSIVDEVHHKTHSQASDHRVDQVAGRGTQSGDKSIPSAFVERALHT